MLYFVGRHTREPVSVVVDDIESYGSNSHIGFVPYHEYH